MLSGSLQDLLMVMYLGKLTKTQLAIADAQACNLRQLTSLGL